ncbi:MAG: pilus assembly protein N-terminal domain-containing protein, partial [Rhodospirillales bacterium]|nr:pilus assembly protein N-terminal domain-containing protein [Rhodospirillales bacterium]
MNMQYRWFLVLVSGVFLGITTGPATSQEVPRRGGSSLGAPPQSLGTVAVERLPDAGLPAVIQVSENKSHALMMPTAVRKIVVGNELIADIYIDKANPNQVFIISKSIGATNVFFMDAEGAIIHRAEIRVTMNPDPLKAALQQLVPDEKIDVSVFRDSVFLSGNVRSAPAAADAVRIAERFVANTANVTNMIKVVGSQQVILQVRVAEMDRGIRKNLSVNQALSLNFNPLGSLDLTNTSPAATLTAFATGTLNHEILALTPATVSALERQSLVKSLAEPTLTAMSGEKASFISGGEIPVPIGVDQNGNAIIEFRDYGISLDFTPVVLSKGRINLLIS